MMISYEQFARLRLREFVPPELEIEENSDWEWMGSHWHNESIGFTSFSQHISTPDETGGLEILFSELPADCIQRLLNAIGLPLVHGMSSADLFRVLGPPTGILHFVSDRKTYEFTVGTAQPYHMDCTVKDAEGLTFLSIVRSDLLDGDDS